jgi:hypothetical protein
VIETFQELLDPENMFGVPDTTDIEREAERIAKTIVSIGVELGTLKVQLKEREGSLANLERQLAQYLQSKGLSGCSLPCGLNPKVSKKLEFYKASGVGDDEVCQFFRDNERPDLVKTSVHFKAMQSALAEMKDRGEEVPSKLFTTREKLSIKMLGRSKFLGAQSNDE